MSDLDVFNLAVAGIALATAAVDAAHGQYGWAGFLLFLAGLNVGAVLA